MDLFRMALALHAFMQSNDPGLNTFKLKIIKDIKVDNNKVTFHYDDNSHFTLEVNKG